MPVSKTRECNQPADLLAPSQLPDRAGIGAAFYSQPSSKTMVWTAVSGRIRSIACKWKIVRSRPGTSLRNTRVSWPGVAKLVAASTRTKVRAAGQSDECQVQNSKITISILLSLGSNQKPSGCLDLAVITAERATNCATEDGGNAASVDRTQYLQKSQDWILQDSK